MVNQVAIYRCPNKRVTGRVVYTNTPPSGAFRGYGLSQTIFAIESAMDELAVKLGIDIFDLRHRNRIKPGDQMVSFGGSPEDVEYGSYGLDQCLDLVRDRLSACTEQAESTDWSVGSGMAMAMIDTIPPRGHFATSRIQIAADGHYKLPWGQRISVAGVRRCISKSRRRRLARCRHGTARAIGHGTGRL